MSLKTFTAALSQLLARQTRVSPLHYKGRNKKMNPTTTAALKSIYFCDAFSISLPLEVFPQSLKLNLCAVNKQKHNFHPHLLFFFSSFVCLQVTCLSCKHKSNTVEPFWDLSLEFPERYHSVDKSSGSTAYQRSCTLTEMLSKFTEMEALEGSIYACNHCNS